LERFAFLNPDMGFNGKGLIKMNSEDKQIQEKIKKQSKLLKKERRKNYLTNYVEKLNKNIHEL
jgi:hypothetical protein